MGAPIRGDLWGKAPVQNMNVFFNISPHGLDEVRMGNLGVGLG